MMYASLADECCRPGLGSSLSSSSTTFCTSAAPRPNRFPRSLQRCALRSSKSSFFFFKQKTAYEIDWRDAVLLHGGQVVRIVAPAEQAAVHFGMQGLYAAVH